MSGFFACGNLGIGLVFQISARTRGITKMTVIDKGPSSGDIRFIACLADNAAIRLNGTTLAVFGV